MKIEDRLISDFFYSILKNPNNNICSSCGFRQTNCEGFYPRFAYGNPQSKVMLVFQNPGKPTRNRLPGIILKTWNDLLKESNADIYNYVFDETSTGVTQWLFKENKFKNQEEYFTIPGKKNFLDSFYISQAYRCPDPENVTSKQRISAMIQCKNYLKEEISIVKPTHIITFGTQARKSVFDVLQLRLENEQKKLKLSFKNRTNISKQNGSPVVICCPHPDSLWRHPVTLEYQEFSSIFNNILIQIAEQRI